MSLSNQTMESFCSFKPPSPSLSPMSQLRFYQDQLQKAHEIIDQLESALADSKQQNASQNYFRSVNNNSRKKSVAFDASLDKPPKPPQVTQRNQLQVPQLKMNHHKMQSLKLDDDSETIQIKQFVTPRESTNQNIEFYQTRNSQKMLSPYHLSSYLQQMQQQRLTQLSNKQEQIQGKQEKINQVKDIIAELQMEIQVSLAKQEDLKQSEKQFYNLSIDKISEEIKNTQEELSLSKETSYQLENVLSQIQESNQQEMEWEDKENQIEIINQIVSSNQNNNEKQSQGKTLKRKRKDSGKKKNTNNKKLLEKINDLKKEVEDIYKTKQQYESYYENRIINLEKELESYKQGKIQPSQDVQLNALLSPNKNTVNICSGDEVLMQMKLDKSSQGARCKTQGSNNTFNFEEYRIKTESAFQPEKAVSVKSFKSSRNPSLIQPEPKPKNRSCDVCIIQ